jgi:hypothetical protein
MAWVVASREELHGNCGPNSISLTSVNNGVVRRGATVPITWTTTGVVGASLRIDLYSKGNLYQNIATGVPTGNRSYNWSVPSAQRVGSGYTVYVSDGGGHVDQSHGYLIIR